MATELRSADAAATRDRMHDAFERRDHAAAVATLAPDVVFHSPILARTAFEGRDVVSDLFRAVMDSFDDLHYTAAAGSGQLQMLPFRARVRGVEIEGVDLLCVDDSGLVKEITVQIRPMAGLAHVAAALGPQLARGPVQRLLLRAFAAPLAFLLTAMEPLIPRLVRTR